MEINTVEDIKTKLGYEITNKDKVLYYDTILNNPYIKMTPYPKQMLNFFLANRLDIEISKLLTGGKAFGGKDLALNTLIPTPNGFKKLEDLMIGDELFDENGNICNLTYKSEIYFNHNCYEITFQCGEKIIAGEEHWWVASTPYERWNNKETLYTTRELYEKHLQLQKNKKKRFISIKNTKPLKLNEKEYLIEPYLLGLWLGDGHSNGYGYSTNDLELIKEFEKNNFTVIKRKNRKYDYTVKKLSPLLKKLNLINNKHIPKEYLRGSYNQRLSLIQGLMDTDGNITKDGACEFTQKNYNVIKGLQELLFTMGIETKINETWKKSQSMKEKEKYYRIKFRTTIPVFRLKRKLERIPKKIRNDRYSQSIIDIKPCEIVPTQCIGVDSESHLFLVGENFIPTHNTYILTALALQYANEKRYRCLVVRKNYQDLIAVSSIFDNIVDWTSEFNDITIRRTAPLKVKFKSGAEIHFLSFDRPESRNKLRGTSFHRMIVDESSQIDEEVLRYLYRSLRKPKNDPIPLSTIFASNPLGVSNQYHINEFVDEKAPNPYVSLGYTDNPYIDVQAYEKSLMELPLLDRISQMMGDWSARLEDGLLISGDDFDSVRLQEMPCDSVFNLVSIDFASTGKDNTALTSICLGSNGNKYLVDTMRISDSHIETSIIKFVKKQYERYRTYYVVGENEAGSSSTYASRYWEDLFREYIPQVLYTDEKPVKSKFERSRPTAMEILNKNLYIIENEDTEDLREQFMYIHPDKKIMAERKSPDLLDSLNQGLYVLNNTCGTGMVGKNMYAKKR